MTATFGNLVKNQRFALRLGLREFCIEAGLDPSNWSKVERGLLSPPQDSCLLERIATILKLPENSDERDGLLDLAAIDAGKIPQRVLNDSEIVKRLPIFFRTMSGRKPSEDDLEKLIEILRHR